MDAALIATGRAPFTKGLGLENVVSDKQLLVPIRQNKAQYLIENWLELKVSRYFFLQINVVTERGFVPVNERMQVIDANGNLVSDCANNAISLTLIYSLF